MIKFNESDKPKALALVCTIIAVFGLIVVRLNALTTAAHPAKEEARPLSTPLPEGQRAQTIFASNEQPQVVISNDQAVLDSNPFKRVLPDPDAPKPAPPAPRPEPIRSYLPREFGPSTANLPVLPAQISGTQLAAVAPDVPRLKLSGVLTGSSPVAVIADGSATRVCGVGEEVSGYQVRAIGQDWVLLARGKQSITLRMSD